MKRSDQDDHVRGARGWLRWGAEFLRGLFDLEFRRLLTPRMMPALYLLAIIGSFLLALGYAAEGFTVSMSLGLLRALLLAPLGFIVMVTLARVALEMCLVLFRIAVHINKMAGHTEEIAGGVPKIQFWKSFRRKDDDSEF